MKPFAIASISLAPCVLALQALPQRLVEQSGTPDSAEVHLAPEGTIRRLAFDLASGKVVEHGQPSPASGLSEYCYSNTDTVGLYVSPPQGEEWIDWGLLGGLSGQECASESSIVSNFEFAYATTSLDTSVGGPGTDLTLTFYTGYQGFGHDSGICPVASFAFTGLPGTAIPDTPSWFAFTVDVSGGNEFCMPNGRFGYGYRGDGDTGPLLCLTGVNPSTGNVSAYDKWAPNPKGVLLETTQTAWPNNYSSWYGRIGRADLSSWPAGVATRNVPPNKTGSLTCSQPILGDQLQITVTAPPGYLFAACFAFDTAVQIPLSGGQVLLCLDQGGFGELLSGAGVPATPAGTTLDGCPQFTVEIPLTKNLDLLGFRFSVQALCAFGVTPFALTSACDMTVGG